MRKKSGPPSSGNRAGSKKPYGTGGQRRPFDSEGRPGRPAEKGEGKRPYGAGRGAAGDRFERPARFKKAEDGDKPARSYGKREGGAREDKRFGSEGRKFDKPRFGNKEEGGRPERSFKKREGSDGERKRFDGDRPSGGYKKREGSDGERKRFDSDRPSGGYKKREGFDGERKRFDSDRPSGGYKKREGFDGERKRFDSDRPSGGYKKREGFDNEEKKFDGDKPMRSYKKRDDFGGGAGKRFGSNKPGFKKEGGFGKGKSFDKKGRPERGGEDERPTRPDPFANPPRKKDRVEDELPEYITEGRDLKKELEEDNTEAKGKNAYKTPHKHKKAATEEEEEPRERPAPKSKTGRKRKFYDEDDEDELEEGAEEQAMTLNKYIAHSGECSRRDAAALVKQGKVKVNGELVTDPGYRVKDIDEVSLLGKKLTPQVEKVYILLNKPKGFITTTEDPQERRTVMDLVANSDVERLYPVGRLDRNTTGLLLMTNDGDLAQRLSHPSFGVKKVYQASLDKPLTKADFDKIVAGVTLDDGPAQVDALSYLDTKSELGLEIHSGRNRIVRRIFESLGYEVEKLDRVVYAGLTKKNLPRGKWRFLNEKEIIFLKHFKS